VLEVLKGDMSEKKGWTCSKPVLHQRQGKSRSAMQKRKKLEMHVFIHSV